MKTLFRAEDLWDLVEKGYADPDEETRLRENTKKDAKALYLIQQTLPDSVLSRIASATTSKEAWITLQNAFRPSPKVIMVRLGTLRQEFEMSYMRSNETVHNYVSRMVGIVSQMRFYGENVSDQTVVAKLLRSLTARFDHIVAAIVESRDLTTLTIGELSCSLRAHEERLNINRSVERLEGVFQVKGETSNAKEGVKVSGRGRVRSRVIGRGRSANERAFNNDRKFHN
ncbi:uncharacterized protein LOC120283003 [Dioscorea cayenensis subsp. rotundata]|uniref:Uncharacterized protein LOC120283003 n=1 Tax=Dioscorea cayennensis subsp. rotundata TaxID=55577 RepID=A0AB40D066_DIOCR|nr:uncharacterized protein LOC120283003 [Dioscorea cayenensis subsp. rotundata]